MDNFEKPKQKPEDYYNKEFPENLPNPDQNQPLEYTIQDLEKMAQINLGKLDELMPEKNDEDLFSEIPEKEKDILDEKIITAIEDLNAFKDELRSYVYRLNEDDQEKLTSEHIQLSSEAQSIIDKIEYIHKEGSKKQLKEAGLQLYNLLFRYGKLVKKARDMLIK